MEEQIVTDAELISAVGNLMDSKTCHLDDVLSQRLEDAFELDSPSAQLHEVAKIAAEFSAIDLGYAVAKLPNNFRYTVYSNLPDWEAKTAFFINTDRATRGIVYRHLTDEGVKELIEQLSPDEAVYALDKLPERRLCRLLEILPESRATAIRDLAHYELRSAGRMMTNEFFAFTMDVTIGQATVVVREQPHIDFSRGIFVVTRERQLQGYVPARNLFINASTVPLRQVMQPVHHKVTPETSRDEVVDLVERYKIPALPVINHEGALIGVINYDDVVEAVEDIADETIAQIAGTLEKVGERGQGPIYMRLFSRAPWLLVTLCGGLVNAASIAYFEGVIAPWLAFCLFFVPLITGMSGNVGVQCSTVLVRGMAIGVLSSRNLKEVIGKELATGFLTGSVFGVLCGFAIYLLNVLGIQALGVNPLVAGFIISAGLFGACLTATVLGVFSPLFFARIGVDPAVASGPIVTAFNDVLSMIIYFVIAQLISVCLLGVA